MIKIYHNPRCSKSREALTLLESSNVAFETIKYLTDPLSVKELTEIIKLLKIDPIDLLRKNEKIWKENFKGKKLSDKEIISIMVDNPKLIERPIIINKNKAIIGRPSTKVDSII